MTDPEFSRHVQPKFRIGDKVDLLRSDGTHEGPYFVTTVSRAAVYTLGKADGQAVNNGAKVMEDELVHSSGGSMPDAPIDGQIRKSAACEGRSCVNCERRHVKCDEARPHCRRCTTTGRECSGYRDSSTADDDYPLPQTMRSDSTFSSSSNTIGKRMDGEKLSNLKAKVTDDVEQDKTRQSVPSPKQGVRSQAAEDQKAEATAITKELFSDLHTACFKSLSLFCRSTSNELGYEFSADDRSDLKDSHAVLNLWLDPIQNGQLEICGQIVPETHITILELFTHIGQLISRVLRVVTDVTPFDIGQTLSSIGWRLITLIRRSSRILWPEVTSYQRLLFMSKNDNGESSDEDIEP